MDWGRSIFWILFGFVLISLLALLFIVLFNGDALLDKDYYERDLRYQSQIEAERNYAQLSEKPILSKTGRSVSIQVQQGEGKAYFFNLNNARLDTTVALKANIPSAIELSRGHWKLRTQWEHNGKSFFFERDVMIEP